MVLEICFRQRFCKGDDAEAAAGNGNSFHFLISFEFSIVPLWIGMVMVISCEAIKVW